MAHAFGLKRGQLLVENVSNVKKFKNGNLIRVKLKKRRPVWLIDATSYMQEYEKHIQEQKSTSDWGRLFELAKKAGGNHGNLLALYVEKVTEKLLVILSILLCYQLFEVEGQLCGG